MGYEDIDRLRDAKRADPERLDGTELFRIAELVVNTDQQDQVAGGFGNLRIGDLYEDRLDVPNTGISAAFFEHRLLNFDRQHLAGDPDPSGEPECVITVATAEITDGLPHLDSKRLHQHRDPLLLLARLTQQPLGTLAVHRLGDGAPLLLRLLILLRDSQGGQRAE